MTQTELANKVEVSPQFIHFILSGKRRPSWHVAKRIAKVLGTDPDIWMEKSPDILAEIVKNSKPGGAVERTATDGEIRHGR
jgi:DNA-binding XRE family transcriptional regulator